MLKAVTILAASLAVVLGANTIAGAHGGAPAARAAKAGNSNALTVVGVLGKRVNVGYHQFVMAYAYCPRGYYVTGGGAYSGAVTEVVSGPTGKLNGWYVDGTQNTQGKTFTHSADAVCVKGTRSVPIAQAAESSVTIHEAEAAYAAANWGAGGR